MTEEQLLNAKYIKSYLSKIKVLTNIDKETTINIGQALYELYANKTFRNSFNKLIKETKERLQK